MLKPETKNKQRGKKNTLMNKLGINVLMRAATEESASILISILNSEDQNKIKQLLLGKDYKGRTALDWARLSNNEAAVSILLEATKKLINMNRIDLINIHSKSTNEKLLEANFQKAKELHIALHQRNEELSLRILMESDINKDEIEDLHERHFSDFIDDFGYSPLIMAAGQNMLDVVNYLMEIGVRIDHQNKFGHTALTVSSSCGHSLVVRLLLFRGANFHLTTPEGFTCLHFACMHGKTHVVQVILQFLKERMALHRPTHPKFDPIRWTSYCQSFEKFLNMKSLEGLKALDLACRSLHSPYRELLSSSSSSSSSLSSSSSPSSTDSDFLIPSESDPSIPPMCLDCQLTPYQVTVAQPSNPNSSIIIHGEAGEEEDSRLRDIYSEEALLQAECSSIPSRAAQIHSIFAETQQQISQWRQFAASEEQMARSSECWLGCGHQDRLERMLNHITHQCPNRSQECPSCAQLIRHKDFKFHTTKSCRLRTVACPNAWEGCGEQVPLAFVDTHLNLRCNYRLVFCRLNCGKEIPFVRRERHESEHCKMRLIHCEFCGEILRSQDMKTHLQHLCSEHLVKCAQGCGEFFKAKEIPKHESEVCFQPCKWGCGQRIKPIQTRVMHELGICQNRPATCKLNCGVQGLIAKYKRDHESHQCLLCPVPCPKDCGLTKILKRDLPSHLDVRTGSCSERMMRCPHNYVGWRISLIETRGLEGIVLKYQREANQDLLYVKFPLKTEWVNLRDTSFILVEKVKGGKAKAAHEKEEFECGWLVASQLDTHLSQTCRFRSILLMGKVNENLEFSRFQGQSIPSHQALQVASEISAFDSSLEPQSLTEQCRYCSQIVDSEPYLLKAHYNQCNFYQLRCSLGCGAVLSRHLMAEHEQACPKRFVVCPLCKDSNLWAEELSDHMGQACPLRPAECQLGCEAPGLTFQSEILHRQNDCPHRLMTCTCGETMQIRLHPRHMNDCVDRLMLCPQGCGLKFMDREMDEHIEFKCDNRYIYFLRRIYCPVGCGFQGPASEITEHVCYRCPRRLIDCPLGCGDSVRFDKSKVHLFYCPKRSLSCEPGMKCCEQVFYKWFSKAPDPIQGEEQAEARPSSLRSSAFIENSKLVMYSRLRMRACSRHGVNALMHAVRFNNFPLAEFVIKQTEGFDLEAESVQGDTALSLACRFGRIKFVELLVQNGANVNHESLTGKTPLIEAARSPVENASIIDFLLQSGATAALKTAKHGRTALDWAKQMGYEDSYRILDIMAQVQQQTCTLFLAISTGDTKRVKDLVADGGLFDPNADITSYEEMNKHIYLCKQAHKEGEILAKKLDIVTRELQRTSQELQISTSQLSSVNLQMLSLLEKREVLSKHYSDQCTRFDSFVRQISPSDLEEMSRLKSPSEPLRIAAFTYGITFGYLNTVDWKETDYGMEQAAKWWPILMPSFINSDDTVAILKGFSFNYYFAVGMNKVRSYALSLCSAIEKSLVATLPPAQLSLLPPKLDSYVNDVTLDPEPSDSQSLASPPSTTSQKSHSKTKSRLRASTRSHEEKEIVLVEDLPPSPIIRPEPLPAPTPAGYILAPIRDEDWDSEAEEAGGGEWVKGEWKSITKKRERWWEPRLQDADELRKVAESAEEQKRRSQEQAIGKGKHLEKIVIIRDEDIPGPPELTSQQKLPPPLGLFLQVQLMLLRTLEELVKIKDQVTVARGQVVQCGQLQVEAKERHKEAAYSHDKALKDRHSIETEMMRQKKLENFSTKKAQMFKRRLRISRLLNQVSPSGHTPISWAASYGNFEAVDLLMLHGSSTGFTPKLMHFSASYLQLSYRMYVLRCKVMARQKLEKDDASLLIPMGEGLDASSSAGISERMDKTKARRELILKAIRHQRLRMRFPVPEAAYTGKWEVIKRIHQRKFFHWNFSNTWCLPSAPPPFSRKVVPYNPKKKKTPLQVVVASGMNDLACGAYIEKSGWVPANHPQDPFGELQAEVQALVDQAQREREAFVAEKQRRRLVAQERRNRQVGEVEMVAAIKRRDFKKCIWLAENASVFVDFEAPSGYTALIAAAEETVTPDKTDWIVNDDGKNCLAVEYLLDRYYYRPGINVVASSGLTALMRAASLNRYHVAQALLDRGADINFQNKEGRTALHFAVEANAMQVLQVLVERGADISLKDCDGLTAFELSEVLLLADPVKLLGQLSNGYSGTVRWTLGEIQDAVSCPFGCGKRLFKYQVDTHYEECSYREVPCPLGCDIKRLMAREVDEHISEQCIYRPSTCELCHCQFRLCEQVQHLQEHCLHRLIPCELHCGNNIKVIEMPKHLKICSWRPMACPLSCGATITVETSFTHVKKFCVNRRVMCPNNCFKWVVVKSLPQHLREVCTNKFEICRFCKGSIPSRDMKTHLKACDLRGASCPAKCGEFVLANNREQHLRETCPHRFIPCELGCGMKVRLIDMPLHLTEECGLHKIPCPHGCVPDRTRSALEQDICCFPANFLKQHSELECHLRPQHCGLCQEPIPVSEMDHHRESTCSCRPVPCRHLGCLKVVPLREREDHERHHCRFRLIPCAQSCGEMVVFLHAGKHIMFNCEMRYEDCPLRCGSRLRHKAMMSHMESDCPRRHAFRDLKFSDSDSYSKRSLSSTSFRMLDDVSLSTKSLTSQSTPQSPSQHPPSKSPTSRKIRESTIQLNKSLSFSLTKSPEERKESSIT